MARLDPRKLETFRVVAQTRKISSAAKLLHLSQPAVTAQIRALEEECGRALLLRSSKGVTPTDWGLRLLEAAKQVHEVLGEVETAFQGEPAIGEEMVLAASMTTAAYVVPPLVAGYRALHGRVPFRLQVSNTARVLEWMAEGRVPLGIVEGHMRSARVHLERYLEDELVAVAASSARDLCGIARAADLAKVPLLLARAGLQHPRGSRGGAGARARVEAGAAVRAAVRLEPVDEDGGGRRARRRVRLALERAARGRRGDRSASCRSAICASPGPSPGRRPRGSSTGPPGSFLAWARRNPPARP